MIYELTVFLHLVGLALGFGGALVSDVMFFSSIKDKRISKQELHFMQLGGRMVWIGLIILFLSGIGLVWFKPALLASSKFLLKMVVVTVIAINGAVFHLRHLPHLRDHVELPFHNSESFLARSHLLTISGAISVVSWFSAAFLGSLPGVPFVLLLQDLLPIEYYSTHSACNTKEATWLLFNIYIVTLLLLIPDKPIS